MSSSFHTNKKAIRLSIAIFLGLILGALFGLVMPDWAEPVTSLISTIYIHSLTMMIYPLVFCSLIVGIKGIGSISTTHGNGGKIVRRDPGAGGVFRPLFPGPSFLPVGGGEQGGAEGKDEQQTEQSFHLILPGFRRSSGPR